MDENSSLRGEEEKVDSSAAVTLVMRRTNNLYFFATVWANYFYRLTMAVGTWV